jgi:hypothetical protein
MPQFDIGDGVRFKTDIRDLTGALADPTTLICRIADPSGNVTVYTFGVDAELVKDATGQYYVDQVIDEAGLWRYRFEASGNLNSHEEKFIEIREQRVS